MAKLSETFKIEGGSNTAPVSNNGQRKLSETFKIGQSLPLPSLQKAPSTTAPIPTYDTNVIKEYESLPKTDVFSRLFSKESRDAYKRKQELNPLYEQNKDLQTKQLLNSVGLSDDDIMRHGGNTAHEQVRLTQTLREKGITDKATIDAIKAYASRRLTEKTDKNLTEYADEHPVAGSALSIPFRMVAGVSGQAENAANYLSGKPLSNSQGALAFNNSVNNMRGAVADDMNGVGQFLYNTGMSMGDMLANRWALGPLGAVGMGMEKATDTTNSAVNQGLTPNQIMLKNISSGVTTYLTEKYLTMPKLDAIKEMGFSALGKEGGKQIVLRALNAAGLAEGAQEGAEDVADWIADALIARDKNEFKQAYDDYKEQGLSDGKAVASVIGDKATELVMDMAGGYLSGFAGGGVEMGKAGITNGINNRNTNVPTLEQQAEIPKVESSLNVGKATTIRNPYKGEIPSQNIENRQRITIPSETVDDANTNLEVSGIDSKLSGRNQRKILTKVYETLFGTDKTSFDVTVNGMTFENRPYNITVNKNAIGKICSDPNMSAEKLAVIDNLNEVIKNSEFVGSGEYSNYKNLERPANVIRYDYFETDAKINGEDYVVAFDVQVEPGHNNYRTHKVINEINLMPSRGETGPVPAAQEGSGLSNSKITQNDASVKSNDLPTLEEPKSNNKLMLEDVGISKGRAREIPSLNESTGNEVEVPVSEIPDPRNGATYTSKTAYTLRNSEVFNQSKKARALIEQQIKDGVFNVDRQTWLAAGTEAVEEIEEKGIDVVKEDILKKKTETTQTQIAQSVYVVDNEIQKAIESGDASELARFTNGFNQRVHKVGQALQAMRMYGNTAAGMVLTTDTISNEETKKAMQTKKGKERAKQNSKLAEAFKRMGYDGSMEKEKVDKTYNQILSEVRATIAREYASQDERFSDTDAEFLARMIFNGATTNEILDALNRHYATGFFGMSSEDLEAINDLYKRADRASSSKERAKLKADAAVIAAKYAGNTSFMDKMNAWRYLAMLGNPRTMIRNVLGNVIFGGVTDVKDAVGAVLESAVIKDGEKTKALINPKTDAELLKATRNDFDKTAYEEATQGGHKYDMKNDIRDSRRVFKTELIEKWRTGTNRVLEESDIKALKSKYAKALAGYLKANGYDASVFKTDNDILDRARAYAIEQAKVATFHADNVLADALNDWSRATANRGPVVKGLGAMLEAVMPFKKTPANILTQGIEYSPLGLFKLASQIHNQAGATAYIDTISKTLTGSGILLLGAALKSAGALIGQKDDKEDPYGKGSSYALKIGDHTYTIDWMAPAALPLFAGAALYDVFNPKGEEGDVTLLDAISSIGEPVVEMSMLQGFNEMLTSFNSDKYKGAALVANELTGYASQYIPTLAGQIARTIDPNRRSTRTNSSSYHHPFAAAFERAGEKALNKIPGLSMTNQKYIDIWGNEQKNTGGNFLGRAIQNFVSPGYWNDTSMTDREKKLADLQKTYEGSGSIIPSLAPSNKPDGSRMTNAEYEKWAKARGQELGKAVDAALKYKGNGTKTEDLQEYIHDIENFANAVAMNKQFKKPIAKTYEKAYEAYKLNGYAGVMEYYRMLNGADLDGNGSVTQEELAKYLRSSDIPRKQREDYFKIKFPKAKEIPTLR